MIKMNLKTKLKFHIETSRNWSDTLTRLYFLLLLLRRPYAFQQLRLAAWVCSDVAFLRTPEQKTSCWRKQNTRPISQISEVSSCLHLTALTCAGPGPPHGERCGRGQRSSGSLSAPTEHCVQTAAGSGDLWRSWFPRLDGGTTRPAPSTPSPAEELRALTRFSPNSPRVFSLISLSVTECWRSKLTDKGYFLFTGGNRTTGIAPCRVLDLKFSQASLEASH